MAAEDLFKQALGLHRQGRLAEAAALYQQANAQGAGFAGLHMLGVLRAQEGRHDEALALIGQALAIDAQVPAAWANHGNVLAALGRWAEALADYDKALARNPAHGTALKGRGDALAALGRPQDAVESYSRALESHAGFIDAWNGRANAWRVLDRFADALADSDRALAVEPGFAEAQYNRGFALFGLGRLDEAVNAFNKAMTLAPADAAALNHKGMALRRLGRQEEAIQSYDAALALAPDDAPILNNRANAWHDLGRHDRALADFDRALAHDPGNAKTRNNRGVSLHKAGRFEAALDSYDGALAIAPSDAEILTNRGVLLREMGRQDAALTDFAAAIAADPSYANAHWNKAVSHLLLGDFAQGWPLYEWRKRLPQPVEARRYPQPLWTGDEAVQGKTVFVYAEQGLGDTIQFLRFAMVLKARGAHVIVSVQDGLVRLLRQASIQGVEIHGAGFVPAAFDLHSPLPSLPLALRSGVGLAADTIPYIRAEDDRVRHWRERIGTEGFRIGISWQGAVGRDDARAFPLAAFDALADKGALRVISLQKGSGSEQLAARPSIARPGIETLEGLDDGPDAFLDTAAVLQSLDLVITLDSAIAHLAGAAGRPVWVALRAVPDWRWQLARDDSPWYPGMRLFRQQQGGDWDHPFAQMRRALDGPLS